MSNLRKNRTAVSLDIENDKVRLKDLSREALSEFVVSQGWEPFRANQIFHWLYRKNVTDFEKMTTIRKDVRALLQELCELTLLRPVSIQRSRFEPTRKYLFALSDGNMVESVYMEDANRRTICVSSQVGCALGCAFCATGRMGFVRNLSPGEIVEQILFIERDVGQEATNIVMMGMGEPFLNYDAVIQAADIISDPEGIAIGKRKITISTSGIIPGIRRFSDEQQRFKLAISLNATTDETRRRLMPITKKYPLHELLAAVREYARKSPFRVTFEYLLIGGVNDTPKDVKRLRSLLADIPCKINLIPYNAVDSVFRPPSEERINEFAAALSDFPAPVTIRRSKGQDIQAACGQLYARKKNEVTTTD